ncbi:hypothetical protein [Xanthomonas sp. 4461]|uniref:hypothetical protein n=1 Tax=Xanthomonas sp. 4461 TaxID=3035313 RepID=UPI002166D666|nr:hypothetical protein [Xanthomonas sp. 4461]MCS3807158.1 hypothetical protein [Xanthomonas sp. 4461]
MTTPVCLTVIGIILQLGGAAFLVYQSLRTFRKLGKYDAQVTYDNFSSIIADLAREVGGQFRQQLVGFLFVLAGSALQLYGAVAA